MAFEDISLGMADQQSMKASLSPSGFSPGRFVIVKGYTNIYDGELRTKKRGIGNCFYLDHPVQGMLNNASYVLDGTFGSWTASTQSIDVPLVTSGAALLASWLANNNPTAPMYVAYGTGTDSVSITQAALTSEVGRKLFSGGYAGGIASVTTSIPAPSNSGAIITEIGLFNSSSGGVMLQRRLLTPSYSSSAYEEKQFEIDLIRESRIPAMDACGNDILKWVAGVATNPPTHFGYGTSSVAVTASTYTSMADEAISRISVSYRMLMDYNTIRFQAKVDEATGTGTNFRLVGLLNASSDGDLQGYFGIPVIYKSAQFAINTMFSIGVISDVAASTVTYQNTFPLYFPFEFYT